MRQRLSLYVLGQFFSFSFFFFRNQIKMKLSPHNSVYTDTRVKYMYTLKVITKGVFFFLFSLKNVNCLMYQTIILR